MSSRFEVEKSANVLPRSLNDLLSRGYSSDGKCGPNHGDLTCDSQSTAYNGTCCVSPVGVTMSSANFETTQSQYGWCGEATEYCGTGCISGCTISTRQMDPTAPRSDGRCGTGYAGATCDANGPYGGCCSQYGYCGSTPEQSVPISLHCSMSW